ncbi:MAG TPA: hypothetical protein VGO04_32350 [Ensifer sp.]|jgi:hypothetical protein|uniref:hypothetical protein n=1 Tax=Ensifer sp. TaxID=1872086 RepID=UPI002E140BA4|nr:hypothetical protein [Ensifer sp.]
MGLMHLGRARLAMALPRHREQLRNTKDQALYDLFEEYAHAARSVDMLMREIPRREDLLTERQQACLDLQAKVLALLVRIEEQKSHADG